MRYLTCGGEHINASVDSHVRYQFIPHIDNVTVPVRVIQRSYALMERTGIGDLRHYLIEALINGSCIIVQRKGRFLVVCNKLEYVIDSSDMAVCDVYER